MKLLEPRGVKNRGKTRFADLISLCTVYTCLKLFLTYSRCGVAAVETPGYQLRRKDLEQEWENHQEERHLIPVTGHEKIGKAEKGEH